MVCCTNVWLNNQGTGILDDTFIIVPMTDTIHSPSVGTSAAALLDVMLPFALWPDTWSIAVTPRQRRSLSWHISGGRSLQVALQPKVVRNVNLLAPPASVHHLIILNEAWIIAYYCIPPFSVCDRLVFLLNYNFHFKHESTWLTCLMDRSWFFDPPNIFSHFWYGCYHICMLFWKFQKFGIGL